MNSVSNDSLSCQTSLATHTPPPAVLDHDPNSSRRKRRRIKDTIDSSLIENYLEDDTPEDTALPVQIPSTGPHTPSVGSDQIEEIHQSDLRLTVGESRGPDQSSNSGTLNDISERSTKPKTLKLNPNGKLLSSPSSSGVEDNPQKTRGRPRGSNRRANEERKPLVLKYAKDDGNREQIGKLIDDIISGQRRLGATECPAAPADRGSQPLKPTHPFFLKKPPRKADMADPIPQVGQDTAVGLSEVGKETPPPIQDKPNLDSSAVSRKAFFSFKQRPKFPEPINPLWPPRDLFHVRGFSTDSHQQSGTGCDVDEKKAKTAAIRISAQENILLSTINEAQRPHEVKTLRVPERYVGSGRILQKAVAKQLSNASIGGIAGDKNPSKPCHPAIKKLSSSIPTSMAAFDRGEFENSLWAHKYMPSSAEEVLQTSREPLVLRDWLKDLMVSAVDTGKPSKDPAKAKWKEGKKKRSKRRKMTQELEGFVDSSENEQSEMDALSDSDEDELAGDVTVSSKRTIIRPGDMAVATRAGGERCRLSNAILLSGPSGCGKTASVYAVAKELGFEVFEINPGSRRTSRDVLERVGNMTRNHLVRNLNAQDQFAGQASQASASEESKKNKMKSFFKPTPAKEPGLKGAEQESDPKPTRNQKQSLILLEEADLLFDEDKPFWSGVMTLISQSKRPIIITCNDESLIPLEDISLHAILRYRAPPQDLAVDYILLLAANEGHMLRRDAVNDLHAVYGRDIRKTITDLSFWCQMAIGSEKSGLDWVIDRWPPRSDLDQHGDPLRVISLNAYQRFMGWFGRDMIGNGLHGEAELSQESLDWWRLSIQDSENMTDWHRFRNSASTAESFVAKPSNERLNGLRQTSDYVDMKSDLDMLCSSCAIDPKKVCSRLSILAGNNLAGCDRYIDSSHLREAKSELHRGLSTATSRPRVRSYFTIHVHWQHI